MEHADAATPSGRCASDAARNRELILETAAEVFAEHGLDAGYDEIARRAGIGVGTVYRRFPERSELVQALFESRIEEMVAIAEEAAARPDAWDGSTWFLEKSVENAGRRPWAQGGHGPDPQRERPDDRRPRTDRADRREPHAAGPGRRRAPAATSRSRIIGMQLMLIGSLSTPEQPDLWRRYLALLFDALRARPDTTPLPLEAPPDEAMHMLMCNLQVAAPSD